MNRVAKGHPLFYFIVTSAGEGVAEKLLELVHSISKQREEQRELRRREWELRQSDWYQNRYESYY